MKKQAKTRFTPTSIFERNNFFKAAHIIIIINASKLETTIVSLPVILAPVFR